MPADQVLATNPAPDQPQPQNGPHWLAVLIGTPLLLLGGFVTAITIVFLCGYLIARFAGEPPAPEFFQFIIVWLLFGVAPISLATLLLRGGLSRKRFSWKVFAAIFVLFVVVGVDGSLGPHDWRHAFRGEKFLATDASSLKRTFVSAHTEVPINPGTNVLWCGTFQLAWNEACQLTGGDLPLERDPPIVTALNKHAFTKASLDDASYVAMAGIVKDGILEKIRKAVDAKFQGAFKPRYIPDKSIARTQNDLIAYACLYKNLTFPSVFERLEDNLSFAGGSVLAFGFMAGRSVKPETYAQVLILDYQSDDDFVIELKTKSAGDRLILAKVEPRATLGETIASLQSRTSTNNVAIATTNDVLMVPRFKFDITREYREIIGLHLASRNLVTDAYISSALQNTRFEMNEKGVELRSEAHMSIACASRQIPVPQHKLIFDKPFLIMMQRSDASVPYFALWVDNPEILVSWK
jgi:hypothetical protein